MHASKQASINVSIYMHMAMCVYQCLHIFVDFRFVWFCFALLTTPDTLPTGFYDDNFTKHLQLHTKTRFLIVVVITVACLFEYLIVKLRLSEYSMYAVNQGW